ncbi:hypothetical protein KGP36_04155 [Patescibacteria group bacterium]|nr:hypothetical protein [Patescibacteria group bacterium]MDE1940573.1 hypothetical protein [Patescibacteria group bacterium]
MKTEDDGILTMELADVIQMFGHVMGYSFMGLNEGIISSYYLEVNDGSSIDVHTQSRIVYLLMLRREIEFHGNKGFLGLAVAAFSKEAQDITSMPRWEVVSIDDPYLESAVADRMLVEMATLRKAYDRSNPGQNVKSSLKFFPDGFPRKIHFISSIQVAPDKKTCVVHFVTK